MSNIAVFQLNRRSQQNETIRFWARCERNNKHSKLEIRQIMVSAKTGIG